jgi:hypothetical protein
MLFCFQFSWIFDGGGGRGGGQYFIANNLKKNPRNTVHSPICEFFNTYSQRKTCKVLIRYLADPDRELVKSAKYYFF